MYGMKGLRMPLRYQRVGGSQSHLPWTKKYKLTHPLVYESKAGLIITVPAGFITNFATWIRPRGKYDVAAAIHDYLYAIKAGKLYADRIFKECMERGGCSRARVNMMYWGVRIGGWFGYYVAPAIAKLKRKY